MLKFQLSSSIVDQFYDPIHSGRTVIYERTVRIARNRIVTVRSRPAGSARTIASPSCVVSRVYTRVAEK